MPTGKLKTARANPWFQPPPPAPILGGRAEGLTPGPRWGQWLGHFFSYASQPYPGGPAFAYEALGLTETSPIGAGTHNREQLRHFNSTLFASNAYWTQGVGGLSQGQFVSAPLTVTGTQPVSGMQTDIGAELLPGQFENWVG